MLGRMRWHTLGVLVYTIRPQAYHGEPGASTKSAFPP